MNEITIIGGGLAGLIAAHHFKQAIVTEAGSRAESHKALLRFRTEDVANLTGVKFRPVTVRKEIHHCGKTIHQPTIALANAYSKKVAGIYAGRSIWNLDTATRYIAPEDLYDRLADRLERERRISWDTEINEFDVHSGKPMINTAPLPVILKLCGYDTSEFDFRRQSISVERYRLPVNTDVYQTIYFPGEETNVFRASITGDLLIIESMGQNPVDSVSYILNAFGLQLDDVDFIGSVEQKYGKIVDLDRSVREGLLYELTDDHKIFSLGRFATWRNILLDDVVKDIGVVDRLMEASSYGRGRTLAKRERTGL